MTDVSSFNNWELTKTIQNGRTRSYRRHLVLKSFWLALVRARYRKSCESHRNLRIRNFVLSERKTKNKLQILKNSTNEISRKIVARFLKAVGYLVNSVVCIGIFRLWLKSGDLKDCATILFFSNPMFEQNPAQQLFNLRNFIYFSPWYIIKHARRMDFCI